MDYTEALGWLDEQEGGKDVANVIRNHVTGLNREAQSWRQKYKGATSEQATTATELEQLRTENTQFKTRIQALETNETELKSQTSNLHQQLQQVKTELETEKGKSTATEASLTEAQTKVKTLETQIAENTTKLTALESEKQTLTRSLGVNEAATIAGAQPKVLQTLLKDDHQIVIENEKVFVVQGEARTELREYADANWKAFVPALFQGAPSPRLPEGGPKGTETKGNTVKKTLGNLYSTPTVKS
ncbi:MAG: hypothetical protein RMY36_023245 [Nostoc sp. SerVER01]|nr:hypothetical protein [Nostoc sp. SerVER01]